VSESVGTFDTCGVGPIGTTIRVTVDVATGVDTVRAETGIGTVGADVVTGVFVTICGESCIGIDTCVGGGIEVLRELSKLGFLIFFY